MNRKMAKFMRDMSLETRSEESETKLAGEYSRNALESWTRGDRHTAFNLYTKAIELNPNDSVALLNRGNLQIEMGDFDAGIDDLEKVRDLESVAKPRPIG